MAQIVHVCFYRRTMPDTFVARLISLVIRAANAGRSRHLHVTLAVDGRTLLDASLLHGFRHLPWGAYPVRADAMRTLLLEHVPHIHALDWIGSRFTVVRAVLDVLGFPRIWPVRTCVTEAARRLGVRRACRWPDDLLRAIDEGDVDHVQSISNAEDQSPA